ncbi:MAG TPA: trehalose-6-phosphate synthase, partial [Usitatibacter sp.]|nr:trehalose-6-phosphate synthase [Usitatibacter sp.]
MARERSRSGSTTSTRPRLLVVSNRLPFTIRASGRGRWTATPGSGGLVTALLPVLRDRGGVWIGWSGRAGPVRPVRSALAAAGKTAGCELEAVALSAEEIHAFYHGFSNEIVWPLFHDLPAFCNFDPAYWDAYRSVNRKFARAVAARADPRDFVWVHDYHLMRVAHEMRAAGSRAHLGFFLHIPFPSPDIFSKLPWRRELLSALLQYDLVGFQTMHDRRNFTACLRLLDEDLAVESRGTMVTIKRGRHTTRVAAFPISIDYNSFMRAAATTEVAAKARELHRLLPRRRLVLGIDRLDYTKGIALRLRAFADLLERYPSMRGKVSLIQVVVPSREDVPEYARMKTEIEQLVGRINGSFARPGGWVPVWYEYRSLTTLELLAYYRAADIALLTPLKDGMNLVAKEYCACSIEEDCVLVLSEFAGAAEQLRNGALLVNPHDVQGVAAAIRAAYAMPVEERSARMRAMRRSIRREDVFDWVESFMRAALARDVGSFPEWRAPLQSSAA